MTTDVYEKSLEELFFFFFFLFECRWLSFAAQQDSRIDGKCVSATNYFLLLKFYDHMKPCPGELFKSAHLCAGTSIFFHFSAQHYCCEFESFPLANARDVMIHPGQCLPSLSTLTRSPPLALIVGLPVMSLLSERILLLLLFSSSSRRVGHPVDLTRPH